MREQQEWTCLPLGSSHCQSKKKSKSPDHLYHQRVRRGYLTSSEMCSANPILNWIQSSLGSVFASIGFACMHVHVPAGIAGLAAAFCAARLTATLGAVVWFAVVRLVLRQQEQSVTQTDCCKLHTGHWDCCWLAFTAHKHRYANTF